MSPERKFLNTFLGVISLSLAAIVGLAVSGVFTPTKTIKYAHTKTIQQTTTVVKEIKAPPKDNRVFGNDTYDKPGHWYYYDLGGGMHDIVIKTHSGKSVECLEDTSVSGRMSCNW